MIESRAVKLDDGRVVALARELDHENGIARENINRSKVQSKGFIINGRYLEKAPAVRRLLAIESKHKDAANQILEDLGYGPNTFSVPIEETDFYASDWDLYPSILVEITTHLEGLDLQVHDFGNLDERPTGRKHIIDALSRKPEAPGKEIAEEAVKDRPGR